MILYREVSDHFVEDSALLRLMSATVGCMNSAKEHEAELVTKWSSAMSENGELLNGLVLPLLVESKMKTFSLAKPVGDDGTDIALKDWQPGLLNYSVEEQSTAVSPSRPYKESVRARFTPIEPRLDEDMHGPRHSSPERFETAPTTPRTPRTCSTGTRSTSASPTRVDSSNHGDSSLEKLGFPPGDDHHLRNDNVVSGIASPRRTAGITFGESSLNDAKSDNLNFRARSDRGRSTLRSRTTEACQGLSGQKLPEWESCTDICLESAPIPTRRVKPTSHCVGPRKGITSADKPRGCPLPLPEIENLHLSHVVSASGVREVQLRHSSVQVRRSLDSICERSKYDSSLNLISDPPASRHESGREDTSISNPNSRSFLLRCNARRQHDDEEGNDDEDVKARSLCSGGLCDNNMSGDFVRLLSKLCRPSVPLLKQFSSKPSQQRGREVVRSNSIPDPRILSWETQYSSIPCQDFVVLGRQNSLKLLYERCSNESTPAYNVHKPRKIRNHEPHQHFYKPISKTLDQMLRS